MSGVLIIGLLKSMTQRFKVECAKNRVEISLVEADFGNRGNSYTLIPYPGEALEAVRSYADKLDNWADAHVIVMPYAEVPGDLDEELEILADEGATIVRAESGSDGWPVIPRKKKADANLIEQIRVRLWVELPVSSTLPEENVAPSVFFRQVCEANPRLIITEQVYQVCDLVEPSRYDFLRRAVDALAEFTRDGSEGRIDNFFRRRKLTHAQSGPNKSALELTFKGKVILDETVETHLKQGDASTPQFAARLYYHHTEVDNGLCVVVTYAGPHPEGNFSRRCAYPEAED